MPNNNEKNSGVILARSRTGESGLKLILFVKDQGIIYALAPGAVGERTRFGGGTEPFVWGVFSFRTGKNNGIYLTDIDIVDDMINLRRRPEAILTAVKWTRLLKRYFISSHPDNDLLANLYWNMKILCDEKIPAEVADWRFMYRWLMLWGIAPDINNFSKNNLNQKFLTQIASADAQDIIKNFKNIFENKNKIIDTNFFKSASGRAEDFLKVNSY